MFKLKFAMQGIGSIFNVSGNPSYDPELKRILNKTPEQRMGEAWARTGDAIKRAMCYEQEKQQQAGLASQAESRRT